MKEPRSEAMPVPTKHQIGVRVGPQLKDQIEAAAAASGRSLAQETELRIVESFKLDSLLSDARTKALLIQVANEIARAESLSKKKWLEDVATHEAASLLVADLFARHRPKDADFERGAALWREIEEIRTKISELDAFLQKCGVLNDQRNALIALAPGTKPILTERSEECWFDPSRPGEPIEEETLDLFREQLAERETLLSYESELEMRMEDTMRPRWDARARGKHFHDALTRNVG